MRTDHDLERAVRAWVAEGSDQLPDPALDAALDRIATTKQRHAGWLARRIQLMNGTPLKLGLAAVAIVAVALLGISLLPGGVGGPPDPTPTPTPVTLASGSFTAPLNETGVAFDIEATETDGSVAGTMEISEEGGDGSVDLQCARTAENGLVTIAGSVTESTHPDMVEGAYLAIVFEPGTPVMTVLWFDDVPSTSDSCAEFLATIPDEHPADALQPIEGNLELGP